MSKIKENEGFKVQMDFFQNLLIQPMKMDDEWGVLVGIGWRNNVWKVFSIGLQMKKKSKKTFS